MNNRLLNILRKSRASLQITLEDNKDLFIVDIGYDGKLFRKKSLLSNVKSIDEEVIMYLEEITKEKFNVGDSVYVLDNLGNRIFGKVYNINDFREPDMKYAILVEGYDDLLFFGGDRIERA